MFWSFYHAKDDYASRLAAEHRICSHGPRGDFFHQCHTWEETAANPGASFSVPPSIAGDGIIFKGCLASAMTQQMDYREGAKDAKKKRKIINTDGHDLQDDLPHIPWARRP
jgi:hypothetical protein